jgi:hypothetical protein
MNEYYLSGRGVFMKCKECYSDHPRRAPLKGAEDEVREYLAERKRMGIGSSPAVRHYPESQDEETR